MLDKEIGFVINTINDPAPTDTVREDGDKKGTESPAKKRKTSQDKLADTAMAFNDMMKETLGVVKEAFGGKGKGTEIDTIEHSVSALQRTIDLINSLNEQIDIISAAPLENDEEETKERKKKS